MKLQRKITKDYYCIGSDRGREALLYKPIRNVLFFRVSLSA